MLFHKFVSQEERRAFGGSDFIELQYCRLPHGSKLRSIISVDAISHWKLDSLYVSGDDMDVFIIRSSIMGSTTMEKAVLLTYSD